MNTAGEQCCSATLIVTGINLDPDAVTEMLGLTPTTTWRRGEQKRMERSDGSVLQFESIHADGGWKCSLWQDIQEASLEEQINHAVDILESHATELAELRGLGFDVELNCSDGSSKSSHLLLDHHLLKKFVELSVDLDISIYR